MLYDACSSLPDLLYSVWQFLGPYGYQRGKWGGMNWGVGTYTAAAAKSLQLCLTLCHPIHGSPPGSSVPGILQARILEWVAISFSNTYTAAAAAAKSHQSCPTLCDLIHGSPPGSSVPGILQARTLEWVATSFSNAWKWKVKVKSLSCVWLFTTSGTAAHQAPPSMGFSRQEYWSGLPFPSPNTYTTIYK